MFAPHSARRIVLATNVAETSLTVPGIRFVIDAGTARIKRYSFRSKVEQLPIEPISQAAANQRAGRCGRVADGICIRLYDEADFLARPKFTDPEIVRSSLAGVILRMQSLNLGSVEDFPFLEAPPKRAIADGYQLLNELGATDGAERADDDRPRARAPAARSAHRPDDPRGAQPRGAARGAGRRQRAQRPGRPRPPARAAAGGRPGARQVRRRQVRVPRRRSSSGTGSSIRAAATASIGSRSRKHEQLLRENFISPRRVREWRDIHAQLQSVVTEHGWRVNASEPTYEQLHQSMLAGLLGNIGVKSDEDESYLGARGIRFWRHPGARLSKKPGTLDRRRRADRDDAALRARHRRDRAALAARARRPPDQDPAARAALGEEGGAGGRARAGDALRHRHLRQQAGRLRQRRSGGGARDLHPRGAGRRRVGDEAAVRQRQPQADRAGRGARAQVAPPGRAGRRRADLRLLRPAGAGRRAQRPDLRALVPRRGRSASRAC